MAKYIQQTKRRYLSMTSLYIFIAIAFIGLLLTIINDRLKHKFELKIAKYMELECIEEIYKDMIGEHKLSKFQKNRFVTSVYLFICMFFILFLIVYSIQWAFVMVGITLFLMYLSYRPFFQMINMANKKCIDILETNTGNKNIIFNVLKDYDIKTKQINCRML